MAEGFSALAYAAKIRYRHACSVRCLRVKTQGIHPRSEFTLQVKHLRVQMQRRPAQARRWPQNCRKCGWVWCWSAGTEWRFAVGALPACLSIPRFWRNCVPEQSQSPRLGGTVMVSQNSVCGQEGLFRATAFGRPGVVIVARTCESKICSHITFVVCWKINLKFGKTISGALVVAPRRSTDNSRCCSRAKSGGRMRPLPRKGVRGRRRYRNSSMAEKRSANDTLTRARASSKFPEQAK